MSEPPAQTCDAVETVYESVASRLYRTHHYSLVRYASRLSRDRSWAEDIVHDAWLRLDRQTHTTAIEEPLAYVRSIIRNLIFAKARRPAIETAVAAEDIRELADDRPSVEAQLIARQTMELVLDAIDAMPERQQAAIKMYYFDGLKLREAAERLGLSVSHTHSLIVDGMKICNRRRQGR